jgi:hypothetical protein
MGYHSCEMTPDIISKLETELRIGITTEVQVVYLMAAIRKLLEQRQAKKQYEDLKFHCDWTLHSKLEGRAAQRILKQFDDANLHLRTGVKLEDLPPGLRREIDRISQMRSFRQERYHFLKANRLPSLEKHRSDGWVHFLHLYAKVVEDCPLVMTGKASKSSSISNVTVHMQLANQPVRDEMLFKVTWTVLDKNGLSGDIFIINSFSLKPRSPNSLGADPGGD